MARVKDFSAKDVRERVDRSGTDRGSSSNKGSSRERREEDEKKAAAKKKKAAAAAKKKKEAEAAAAKKAAAAGPALEDIPADEMLDHIEAIREIMEFSDQEKEIRVMCEQSSIPSALVDIAVSEPDKLDELEKKAEG